MAENVELKMILAEKFQTLIMTNTTEILFFEESFDIAIYFEGDCRSALLEM